MATSECQRHSEAPTEPADETGLIVSWCVGHLVSPLDAAGYDESFKKWRYDDLPILPGPFRYVTAPGKEDAFENLRSLMGRPDVEAVVNACDAGREWEQRLTAIAKGEADPGGFLDGIRDMVGSWSRPIPRYPRTDKSCSPRKRK